MIATTTAEHASLLRLATAAGLPPSARSQSRSTSRLWTASPKKSRKRHAHPGRYQRRFDAGYRGAQAAVAGGRLGALLALRASTDDSVPPSEKFIADSGGIFRDLLINEFDAIGS